MFRGFLKWFKILCVCEYRVLFCFGEIFFIFFSKFLKVFLKKEVEEVLVEWEEREVKGGVCKEGY